MTRFPNREDDGYHAVLGSLRRWKKSAHEASSNGQHSG